MADSIRSCIYFDRQIGEGFFQLGIFRFVGYNYRFRLEFPSLGNEFFYTVVGGQHIRFVLVGLFFNHL